MARIIKKTFLNKFMQIFGYIKEADMVKLFSSSMFAQATGGLATTEKTYSALCDAYTSWVYTCIDKIAKTVAMLPLELYIYKKGETKLKGLQIKSLLRNIKNPIDRKLYLKQQGIEKILVKNHPFLDLMYHPNTLDTRFTLWYNMMVHMELTGSCFTYMPHNMLGLPGEMWVLPLRKSASIKIVPDPKILIKEYKYVDGTLSQIFQPDEMLFLRYPNPSTPFEGKSPLVAQEYPYDIDIYLMQQQRALLKNKARFGNVFTTDERLLDPQITAMKELIKEQYEGSAESGKDIFMHSGLKLDNRSLTQTAKDMMLKDLSEFARDKIISSFDLTPGKVGLIKDVNRSTAEIMDETYYKECINPKTMLIEEGYETWVLPKYNEFLTLDFKLPDFKNREADIKERETNLKTGYTTINEERLHAGFDEVPWGNKPWFPFNMTQVNSESTQEEQPVKHKNLLNANFWTKDNKTKAAEIFSMNVESRKNILVPVMQYHFNRQLSEVLIRLDAMGKSVQGHLAGWGNNKRRVWVKDNQSRINKINIDKEKEAILLGQELTPAMELVLQDAGDMRLVSLGVVMPFNVNNPAVVNWLDLRLRKEHCKIIENTTFEDITMILRQGFQEGQPLTIIGNTLKEKFGQYDKYRAQMISRTETISASNFADLQSTKQSGMDKKLNKFWINEVDARETHQAAGSIYSENGAIPVDKNFDVGEGSGSCPGNIGVAAEDINCRCTLGYVEKK